MFGRQNLVAAGEHAPEGDHLHRCLQHPAQVGQGAQRDLTTAAEAQQAHGRATAREIAIGQQAVGDHLGHALVEDRAIALVRRHPHHQDVAQIDHGPEQGLGMADAQPIHPAPELTQPTALGQRLVDHRVGHYPAHDGDVGGEPFTQSAQEVLPFRQGLHRGLADAIEIHHPALDRLVRVDRCGQGSDAEGRPQLLAKPAGPPAQGFKGSEEGAHQEQQQPHRDQIDRQSEAVVHGGVGQLQQQAGARQQGQRHQPQDQ